MGQAIKLWHILLSLCTKRPCVTSCLVWPPRFPAVTMRMCHQEQPSPTLHGLNRLLEKDPSQHGVSRCLDEFLSPLGLCALHPICAGQENQRHSSGVVVLREFMVLGQPGFCTISSSTSKQFLLFLLFFKYPEVSVGVGYGAQSLLKGFLVTLRTQPKVLCESSEALIQEQELWA